ncbi:MAG: EF2563 family selenium-dependent molybdenum hydroxylase system protein [Anaerolineales bacterium]|nr:EF2563 family selenium-dependent molybdenum hydroxylase system protein [Anaerolineales bacterium]
MSATILVRGGGDLASGIVLRLHKAGLNVVITELPQPLAVRRSVAFCEAVYEGQVTIEKLGGVRIADPTDTFSILNVFARQAVPVLIDPDCRAAISLHPLAIIDARMTKLPPEPFRHSALLYIGLGPGFIAGDNCHAVIETSRGHTLGRVYWQGETLADTGLPDTVQGQRAERVLRSPASGEFTALAEIRDQVEAGQVVAKVAGQEVTVPFKGVLRGLIRSGLVVKKGLKIGDLDPRNDPEVCSLVSDKALAVGGGVLEALLSRPEVRRSLWT